MARAVLRSLSTHGTQKKELVHVTVLCVDCQHMDTEETFSACDSSLCRLSTHGHRRNS